MKIAINLEPLNTLILQNYGMFLVYDLNKIDEGIKQLEKVLEIDPLCWKIHSHLASIYNDLLDNSIKASYYTAQAIVLQASQNKKNQIDYQFHQIQYSKNVCFFFTHSFVCFAHK